MISLIAFDDLETNVDEFCVDRGSQEVNGSKSQCDRQNVGENNNANDQILDLI